MCYITTSQIYSIFGKYQSINWTTSRAGDFETDNLMSKLYDNSISNNGAICGMAEDSNKKPEIRQIPVKGRDKTYTVIV